MAYSTEQRREYSRQYRERRKSNAKTVLGGRCRECLTTKDLEFEHIDPLSKIDTISNLLTSSKEIFWTEVLKCQLLCSTCHKEKSKKQYILTQGNKFGEDACNAKLNIDQVNEIKKLYKTGKYSQRSLGKMFNVHHTTIGNITRSKHWVGMQTAKQTGCKPAT